MFQYLRFCDIFRIELQASSDQFKVIVHAKEGLCDPPLCKKKVP